MFKIEIGLCNNEGYPNNVIKTIITEIENTEMFINELRNLSVDTNSFIVSVQKNNESEFYIEIDANALGNREQAEEIFREKIKFEIKDLL